MVKEKTYICTLLVIVFTTNLFHILIDFVLTDIGLDIEVIYHQSVWDVD